MAFKKFELRDGHELRGFLVRLYPDAETERQLEATSECMKRLWNWLVKQGDEQGQANAAGVVRAGLIGPKPRRPDYVGMTSRQSEVAKQLHREAVNKWFAELKPLVATSPKRGFWPSTENNKQTESWMTTHGVKWDYQMLQTVIRWLYPDTWRGVNIGAHMLQALVKNFYGSKGWKKYKRRTDHGTIGVRSGMCFKQGNFGARGRTHRNPRFGLPNENYYNCQVTINGWKIKGRMPGKKPEGRVLEGVSLTKQADGWYAAIKVEVPIRAPEASVAGSKIGLDVGLDNLVAYSEPVVITNQSGSYETQVVANSRRHKLSKTLATLQEADHPTGRLHQKMRRHNLAQIYNLVIKPLARYETIVVEDLTSKIGQMGSTIMSSMRTIVSLLKQRYGDRVQEVDCAYTSQDCSNCGIRDKEAWAYSEHNFCVCKHCNYYAHRDINAARNIVAKL